jgi:hypothetical protein
MFIRPDLLLRLEALFVLLLALIWYSEPHGSWLLFVVLFLVPDLSLLGYLVEGKGRFSAALYNVADAYAVPLSVALIAWRSHSLIWEKFAAIWIAHIAFDRVVGFGLKYAQAPSAHPHPIRPPLSTLVALLSSGTERSRRRDFVVPADPSS